MQYIQLLQSSPQAQVWYLSSPLNTGSTHKVRKDILDYKSEKRRGSVSYPGYLPFSTTLSHFPTACCFSKDSKPWTRQFKAYLFIQ